MISGERLSARMSALAISQSELARRVGISQATVWKLIHGESRGTTHIARLARVLGTTPAYLEGETDDPDEGAPPPPQPLPFQIITMGVALPAQAALEAMFEGLIRSMPGVKKGALPRELAKLLPSALQQLRGPLRFETTSDRDDVDASPEDQPRESPARRRA